MSPGSDVANLTVMGYDTRQCYTGRSPLEAANIGIELSDEDVALRCNLVTLSEDEPYEEKTLLDYCAGDISTGEADQLSAPYSRRSAAESLISTREPPTAIVSSGMGEKVSWEKLLLPTTSPAV